jgi:methionine-rich copper-binding protein CopC
VKIVLTCFLIMLLMACNPSSDTTPPTAPQGFNAVVGDTKINLQWNANSELDLANYVLKWGLQASQLTNQSTISKDQTAFSVTGLTNGTTYDFILQAVDNVGNTSSGTNIVSATPIFIDITSPRILSSIPARNATNLAINTQLQLTFSEAMNVATVTTSSSNLTLGAATWSAGNTIVNFVTPVLKNDTAYMVLIDGKDLAGNSLSGATTLQFSSVPAAPTLTSSTPINNTLDVSIASKITWHFSKPMNKTSLETAFSSVPSIACTWVWIDADQTATCTPTANLAFLTEYTLTLASSAKSASDIALTSPFVSHFTTVKDTVKPALTSYSPSDPETFATAFDAPIVLNFSKPMNQTSVQNAFQSQPSIACVWTWTTPSSASCQPSGRLEQRITYAITLGIAATDLAGNNLQTAYGFTFRVGDAPPKVIRATPSSGFSFESVSTPIVITFSEQMQKVLTSNAFLVRVGGAVKAGTITWNSDCGLFSGTTPTWTKCTQLTFTPTTPYPNANTVIWSISTSATDSGELLSLENEVTGSFQTEPRNGGP